MNRRIAWFLAFLAAGLVCGPAAAQTLKVSQDDRAVRIAGPSGSVAEYAYRPSPLKPYFSQLMTPGGVQVVRDSPADHKHHHGLMLALGIDGVDFWSETKDCGLQAHLALDGPREFAIAGMPTAQFTQRLEWRSADAKPLARERRTITVVLGKSLPTRLLIWRTRLETPPGLAEVKLWGRDYFGLGVRFVASMDNDKARFSFPDGARSETSKGHTLTKARWCACTGPADGRTITLAMYDHLQNDRHPARFFTMSKPFAYVSATLDLSTEPLVLKAGRALELCYGVALWDGEADAGQVQALYERWLALTGPDK